MPHTLSACFTSVLIACLLAACQSAPGAVAIQEESDAPRILITVVLGETHEAGVLNSFSGGYYRGNYGPPLSTRQQLQAIERDYPVREVAGWAIDSLAVYCGLYQTDPEADVDSLLRELAADPRVESSQLLHHYRTRAEPSYNDPYFDLQYGRARDFILGLHRQATGEGVDVAIIDTGLDAHHPELQPQVASEHVFLLGDSGDRHHDIHGTAVAGIIAAAANNGLGIVGLAPGARIHSLQACRQVDRNSSLAQCDSFTVARALDFAIDHEYQVINLSLSGPEDPLVARLVAAALARNQVIAAADPGVGHDRFPAMLPGVLAVSVDLDTATDTTPEDHPLVVRTPGNRLLSTGPGGGYDYFSGSSMATALVSGLTALSLQSESDISTERRAAWLNEIIRQGLSPAAQRAPLAVTSPRAGFGPRDAVQPPGVAFPR